MSDGSVYVLLVSVNSVRLAYGGLSRTIVRASTVAQVLAASRRSLPVRLRSSPDRRSHSQARVRASHSARAAAPASVSRSSTRRRSAGPAPWSPARPEPAARPAARPRGGSCPGDPPTGERLVPGLRRTKSSSRNCATDRPAARPDRICSRMARMDRGIVSRIAIATWSGVCVCHAAMVHYLTELSV